MYVFHLKLFQEMSEVIAWIKDVLTADVIGSGFWTSGKDISGDNTVHWLLGNITPSNVIAALWAPGEPAHWSGDCVRLNVGSNGLELHTCDGTFYPICKI